MGLHFLGVVVAITLYSVIGAVVSRAIGNPDMKQALFAGIAAPAIVVSVLSGASDSQSLRQNPQGSQSRIINFLSSAFAQSPSPANLRRVTVLIEATGDYPVEGTIQILATMSGDMLSQIGQVQLFGSKTVTQVSIPTAPTRLVFRSTSGDTQVLADRDVSMVTVQVDPVTSFSKDLQWALGSQRTLAIGRLRATAQ